MSIVIEHLNYVYMQGGPYETKALDDVSLTIHDGEFVGLIGHTGSGKSTLVQHLNGLILPTSGQITVDGMDLADKNTDKRAIGLDVPQAVELAQKLREKGFDVPEGIYKIEEVRAAVEAIVGKGGRHA